MNNKEFAIKVQADIAERLGENYHVCTKEVVKNNDVVMQGLMIYEKGQNVAPTIYLEAFLESYEQGKPWDEVMEKILTVYENRVPRDTIDVDFFDDFEKVKDRIAYKLIHAKRNEALLSKIPHVKFLDLAICFYYAFSHEILGNGSILVYNTQMERWKTNAEELHLLAQENTRRLFGMELLSMERVLAELAGSKRDMGIDMDLYDASKNTAMQILSNEGRMYGAVSMLYPGFMQELADKLDANLYILPSSIHEVILIAQTGQEDIAFLKNMVKEVNDTQVLPEEILSDSVYYYDKESQQFSCF